MGTQFQAVLDSARKDHIQAKMNAESVRNRWLNRETGVIALGDASSTAQMIGKRVEYILDHSRQFMSG